MNGQPNFSHVIFSVMALVGGLGMLTAGGEFLVSGSVKLARRWGLTQMLIGLTVVAFGTSMPELFVGLIALFQDHPDIMIGNVIGSNIANIGLILGTSALLLPLKVKYYAIRKELYLVLTATLLLVLITLYGTFTRLLGFLFVCGIILYTFLLYRQAARNKNNSTKLNPPSNHIDKSSQNMESTVHSYLLISCLTVGGFLLLALGSNFFINGAVDIARQMKISELVIGLTLAAIGTSLPELASSFAAIRHKESDLLIGNIIGSNLFNLLMVLGCGAITRPYILSPQLITRDLPVMFAFSAVLIPILAIHQKLGRPYGLALLCTYCLYIFLLT